MRWSALAGVGLAHLSGRAQAFVASPAAFAASSVVKRSAQQSSSESRGIRARQSSGGSVRGGAASLSALSMFDSVDVFQLQQQAGQLAASELTHISPLSLAVMYATGVTMSFSPCALGLLPLTMGYIAGTQEEVEREAKEEREAKLAADGGGSVVAEGDEAAGESSSLLDWGDDDDDDGFNSFGLAQTGFLPSAAFAAGLATMLSIFGVSAALSGKAVGFSTVMSVGGEVGEAVLPTLSAGIAVAMGLNLLNVINISLPSLGSNDGSVGFLRKVPRSARTYALGASSAFIASPCCTPVLASILGFVATSQDPVLGLGLLLFYSLGYTTTLVIAGTASGTLSRIMSSSGLTWVPSASGAVLISYGTWTGLSALFGQAATGL